MVNTKQEVRQKLPCINKSFDILNFIHNEIYCSELAETFEERVDLEVEPCFDVDGQHMIDDVFSIHHQEEMWVPHH